MRTLLRVAFAINVIDVALYWRDIVHPLGALALFGIVYVASVKPVEGAP